MAEPQLYTLADGTTVPWYHILRRAGYIPSTELWDPVDNEELPTDPENETWVPTWSTNMIEDTILPYQAQPMAVAHILAMAPEDLPRRLAEPGSVLEKAIAQARLDGSLP